MPLRRVSVRLLDARTSWLAALLAGLVLLATAGPAGALLAPGRAVAVPQYTLEERAAAIASPSLVYLETIYTGQVRDKQTLQPLVASPVNYHRRCSGFVVNSNGHVVTTRSCVSPPNATIHQQMLYDAGGALIAQKKLEKAQLDSWVKASLDTTVVTGSTESSAPEKQLLGQLNIAVGAKKDAPATPGSVVKESDPNDGNIAVVKLERDNLPAVEIHASSTPATGTQVVALGFNTDDSDQRVGTYTSSSRLVQVVGEDKRGTATYYRTNEKLDTYFQGGMAVDTSGRVVGIVDSDPNLPNRPTRAVYSISTVTAVLNAAGVPNVLGEADKLYRSGLDAYFTGRYATAISQLDRTTKAVPANQVAQVYRQHAIDRQKIEGEPPAAAPSWLVPTIAGAGGAVLATLIVLLVMLLRGRARHRAAPDPASPYPFAPVSAVPTSGAPAPPSFAPVSGAPTSGMPISGMPISGMPVSPVPVSQPPYNQAPYEGNIYQPALANQVWTAEPEAQPPTVVSFADQTPSTEEPEPPQQVTADPAAHPASPAPPPTTVGWHTQPTWRDSDTDPEAAPTNPWAWPPEAQR
jgi:Trypsin-like peptidase domain